LAAGVALVKQEKYSDAIPLLERALEKHRIMSTLSFIWVLPSHVGASLAGDAKSGNSRSLEYYRQAQRIAPETGFCTKFMGSSSF